MNVLRGLLCWSIYNVFFVDLVSFFKGVSLDFKRILASFSVKKSRLCSMGHMLAFIRRLFIGVERNAPRPTLIAELKEV